jgi:RES domain-containing protein
LSGDGAAAKGGRFNPIGVPALCLALTAEGVFLEMGPGFAHRFDPLTVCSYGVDVDDLLDLRTEADCAIAGIDFVDMSCAWAYDLANGRKPASWRVAEELIKAGASGILVPSFATGAKVDTANLVLWKWSSDLPHKVEVHDPNKRLPKDQSSWRS